MLSPLSPLCVHCPQSSGSALWVARATGLCLRLIQNPTQTCLIKPYGAFDASDVCLMLPDKLQGIHNRPGISGIMGSCSSMGSMRGLAKNHMYHVYHLSHLYHMRWKAGIAIAGSTVGSASASHQP